MRGLLIFLLLVTAPAAAQTPPILQALRANDWDRARNLAGPDPLAEKLVDFIRLLNPGQASAGEIQAFRAANPRWPDMATLEHRYGEALIDEPDERLLAALCQAARPSAASALLRCAEAYALAGDAAAAHGAARTAWVEGLNTPAQEADFEARWGTLPTRTDQRRRFDQLIGQNTAAASRQLGRLDPDFRPLAAARLALRRDDPDALAVLTAVPEHARDTPGLLLDEARFLRRSHASQAALALWRTALPAAEASSDPDQRPAFWAEREALARDLLALNQNQDAAFLAGDPSLSAEQAIDSDFLAGWIALRRLNDPAAARTSFLALAAASHAAITQARALYWLGRAEQGAAAQADFTRAASWPFTYYGQLAAKQAGISVASRIAAQADPPIPATVARAVQADELARAALILSDWGDPRRAADFLAKLIEPPASLAQRTEVAQLALRLGLPDIAVQSARLAGRDGGVIAKSGWPVPVTPPPGPVPPALALALMRQESSFNARIVSAAGAQGLMQLMPATAASMGRALREANTPLDDPGVNMRLGEAYIATLLAQFGNVLPYAIAAYNAGPHRVRGWIAANGDAGKDETAMIDWIELIPFAETRNYVQRVLENAEIYQAK
jgi:soluble lytic murein transglycosylase